MDGTQERKRERKGREVASLHLFELAAERERQRTNRHGVRMRETRRSRRRIQCHTKFVLSGSSKSIK